MNHVRRSIALTVTSAIAVTATLGLLAGSAGAGGGGRGGRPRDCRGIRHLTVPGAEHLEAACLGDLTTAGTVTTGHTDPADFAPLSVPSTINPTGVPGIQLDGYFPDTSTFNATHGWNHDAQFVIRLPRNWNGGLVVAGPPGTRRQYASDVIISDTVLAQGYAYASTDKGNNGPTIYQDGIEPGDAIAEWNARVTELTIAAKDVVEQRYHRTPKRTYIAGFSAAGYLTRWQLENRPDLYDGGIDWSGLMITLSRASSPTCRPPSPSTPSTPPGRSRPIRSSSTQASRPAPSRSGNSATAPSGIRSSEPSARSSTPPSTATPRPATRSVRQEHPTVTPTTTSIPGHPR